MKKNRPRAIHYILTNTDDNQTICGKDLDHFRIVEVTKDKNKVTCKRCLEVMKKKYWYCENCGFINGKKVTYDEA